MTKAQNSFLDTEKNPSREEIEHAYYNTGHPLLTDDEYDELPQAEKVGAPIPENVPQEKHSIPMLSLEKIHTKDELEKFIKTCMEELGMKSPPALNADLKQDGMSCSITYENGTFQKALSRGNGTDGEIITETVFNLESVPKTIPIQEKTIINGELSLPKVKFNEINKEQKEKELKEYKTPRNATSGIIRDSNKKRAAESGIEFIAWGVPDIKSWTQETHARTMLDLEEWGFNIVPESVNISNCETTEEAAEAIFRFFEKTIKNRKNLEHDIDGIVIKLAKPEDQASLGSRSRTPRWAISLKPPAERKTTKLLDIKIQVGSTGALTPVAILEPVTIGNVTITNATLHNEDTIKDLDLRIGDAVLVERANDVIPKIIKTSGAHPENSQPFEFPKTCPSCGSPARREEGKGAAHYCSSTLTCPGTRTARFLRLVGKKIFNIDTLGEGTIKALCDAEILKKPADLFTLPQKHDLQNNPEIQNWGAGKQKNLEDAIEKSKIVPLNKFIASLLIQKIGETASRQLSELYRTLPNFLLAVPLIAEKDEKTIQEIKKLPEFGDILTKNLVEWLQSEENVKTMKELLDVIEVIDLEEIKEGPLNGETIVFTGKMTLGSRDEMRKMAENQGAKTSDTLSKNTTILVYGENAGKKIETAKKYQEKNIPIILLSEEEWKKKISQKKEKEISPETKKPQKINPKDLW